MLRVHRCDQSDAPRIATRETRIDQGVRFTPVIDQASGYLRTSARLTRVGVFVYPLPDGTKRREFRPPDEVFNQDSIESLRVVPVCNDHPTEPVSSANARSYARGTIGDRVEQDGDFVSSSIAIWDSELIALAQNGKQELSCGYTCDVEFSPGMYNGIAYDAVQRNIRYNHVAVVEQGRAGPAVRMRLDSKDIEVTPGELAHGDQSMELELLNAFLAVLGLDQVQNRADGISIDGKRYKLNTKEEIAAAKSALDEYIKKAKDSLKKPKEESKGDALELIAKKDARIDALEEENEKLREELAEAKKDGTDEAVQKRVKERSDLIALASKLAPSVKTDGLDNAAIMRAVLIDRAPEAKRDALGKKLDDGGAVYIKARFDDLREREGERVDNSTELARATIGARNAGGGSSASNNGGGSSDRVDHVDARQAFISGIGKREEPAGAKAVGERN